MEYVNKVQCMSFSYLLLNQSINSNQWGTSNYKVILTWRKKLTDHAMLDSRRRMCLLKYSIKIVHSCLFFHQKRFLFNKFIFVWYNMCFRWALDKCIFHSDDFPLAKTYGGICYGSKVREPLFVRLNELGLIISMDYKLSFLCTLVICFSLIESTVSLFSDVTSAVGFVGNIDGVTAAFGDFNADKKADIFVITEGAASM